MDSLQLAHNSHLSKNLSFAESDPNLRKMDSQKVKYQPELLNQLPQSEPGIYLLTGGRQVGKTTSLKLWMKLLLNKGWSPNNIIFLTGEIISNHYQLIEIINQMVENYFKNSQLSVLIIDEITYIENWDKGIKFLADLGVFNKIILILTGSDQKILKDAPMTFPGRRGQALKDFRLWPLSFKETLLAKKIIASDESKEIENLTDEILEKAFSEYLMHGGYLVAINDWAKSGKIEEQTYKIYSDWITGDFLKRTKSEQFLKEILAALIKRYGSTISWNNLAKDLSIDHPATVASYIELLVSLEALYVLPALIEDKLQPAPKKGKKIFFLDPFIYHSVKYLNQPNGSLAVKDSEELSLIIEGIASAHYYRNYPCYYIKADKEVDLAYIKNDKFYPVEIKWTNQVRPEDLKQILKYQNGLILSKNHGESKIDNTPVRFLPRELLKL
jgi:predicted AAA+ superfamily ATPase